MRCWGVTKHMARRPLNGLPLNGLPLCFCRDSPSSGACRAGEEQSINRRGLPEHERLPCLGLECP